MRRAPILRGYTMIELMLTVVIVSVLAGLALAGFGRMKNRGNFASATGEFLAALRAARAEAFARGNPCVVIVDTAAGRWWAIEDALGTFSLASFNPGNPAPANPDGGTGDRLLYSGTLPDGISFGPQSGWGAALPPPLSGIPTGYLNVVLADGGSGGTIDISADGGSSAPNSKYCSFCDPATGQGAITFLPSGGASFSGGPLTVGQQISMQDTNADGGTGVTGIISFAVVAATGTIEAVTIR
jgi:prepilin-type N-terminal cleavage/methylation domain-containing protein